MNCTLHIHRFGLRSISYSRRNDVYGRFFCGQHATSPSPSRRPVPANTTRSRHRQQRGNNGDSTVPPYVIYGFVAPVTGLTATAAYAYYSCLDEVPYTRRRRFLATTPQWEEKLGHEQHRELLAQFRGEILPPDHRASVTVQRVGGHLAAAARRCAQEWAPADADAEARPPAYTYTVVQSPMANAFVLPGNHIFVLTGMLRYVRDEDELAAIFGHEFAHNLARHAGERASENVLLALIRGLALLVDPTGTALALLLPAQALLFSLPHSREHEAEADRIGVLLAGEACYDPRAARRVFERMRAEADCGSRRSSATPPEFMSTHPGYDTRLTLFDRWMTEALGRYNTNGWNRCRAIRQEMKHARRLAAETHSEKEGR